MLLLFGSLGLPEIIVILVLAVLVFGPKKLPELGRSLGKGLREFKKGTSGLMDSLNVDSTPPTNTQANQTPPPKAKPQGSPGPSMHAQAPVDTDDEDEMVIDLEKKDNQGT